MAIAKNGILGGFSGSVGDVVGANWKGVNTIRLKSAIPKKPLTAKQKQALYYSKMVLDFWKAYGRFIDPNLLISNKIGVSGMNVFQKKYRANVLFSLERARTLEILNNNPTLPFLSGLKKPIAGSSVYQCSAMYSNEIKTKYPNGGVTLCLTQWRFTNEGRELIREYFFPDLDISYEGFSLALDVLDNSVGLWYYYFKAYNYNDRENYSTYQYATFVY